FGTGAPDPAPFGTGPPDPATFLSGESGTVGGIRLTITRALADAALGAAAALSFTGRRLDRLAAAQQPRRVLVLSVYRPGSKLPEALRRLVSDRHEVRLVLGATADVDPALEGHTVLARMSGGKFENLNRLLAAAPPLDEYDWVLVVDDDVALARRFLDRHIALCERLGLDLSQPAQSLRSHAAWRVTRRRAFSLARITRYVEIGPVTAFTRPVAQALTPFPQLRFGWGLDNHWGALAHQHGWRLGVVDALAVRHETRHVAAGYAHADAIAEAQAFLEDKPYVGAAQAQRTVHTIRRVNAARAPLARMRGPKARPAEPRAKDGARRVLVVPKWYPWPDQPVLGLFCREHARALSEHHDVVVLASRATPSPGFAVYRLTDEAEDGLRTIRVRYRRPRVRALAMVCQIAGMLAALARLRREGFRPAVVHAHVFSAGLPALILGRLSRAVVVVTEHYTGFGRGLVRGADLLTARLAFTAADLVAPVSAELCGHLRKIAPRASMKVMPNVVDTEVFTAAAHDAHQGPARLLTVGALAEKKGHTHLLDALAELRTRREATLDLVGGGELHERLERQARRLGLSEAVRFHGELPKERVAELMREADLLVMASLHETFGCVLIEAMASGLPSVATRVGGVPEVLSAEAGALVAPRDPAALAAAIEETLDRRFDPAALARAARERYSYDAFARGWSEVYDSLGARRDG
ncbi:MAG: glycosyltransferase, partial [Actinomycetota bacterium]|nr:glycosyltransferase [Actinomycetota bacterium]